MEIPKIGKLICQQRFLPRSSKKSGELWSTNNKAAWTHEFGPTQINFVFGRPYFGLLAGAAASDVYTR